MKTARLVGSNARLSPVSWFGSSPRRKDICISLMSESLRSFWSLSLLSFQSFVHSFIHSHSPKYIYLFTPQIPWLFCPTTASFPNVDNTVQTLQHIGLNIWRLHFVAWLKTLSGGSFYTSIFSPLHRHRVKLVDSLFTQLSKREKSEARYIRHRRSSGFALQQTESDTMEATNAFVQRDLLLYCASCCEVEFGRGVSSVSWLGGSQMRSEKARVIVDKLFAVVFVIRSFILLPRYKLLTLPNASTFPLFSASTL